jgi:hypothetical protein
MMWKESVVAYFKIGLISRHQFEGAEEDHANPQLVFGPSLDFGTFQTRSSSDNNLTDIFSDRPDCCETVHYVKKFPLSKIGPYLLGESNIYFCSYQ